MKKPIIRIFINFLLECVLKIMPENRSVWGQAMKVEIQNQTDDIQALKWALGCLKTSTMERIKTMKTGTLRVSKTVLSLEVVCCFIPVSFVFAQLIYEILNSISHGGGFTNPNTVEMLIMIFTAFTLIGPIGIILGLRYLLGGAINLGVILKPILTILAAGIVIVGLIWLMTFEDMIEMARFDDWWLAISMVALMPALAIFHLLYLSQGKRKIVH